MAFVNEYIPEADFEKYGLAEIDSKFLTTGVKSRDWTVDRERNIYLRQVTTYREDMENIARWNLFWKGDLLWLDKKVLEATGQLGGAIWVHLRITNFKIPLHLVQHQDEIFEDLREAFLAYRDGGVFSTCTEFSMQLDIEE
jgi:hypothetical protein